ncbi:hypothetical protein [Rathayibacter sp. VKM Ac-2630]|uniref:hypothetical protein n=1 Tax=Rathayibacter sp. VKM Ac-2630 TaxID=1938617 RepID=UPI00191C3F9E|nr:hypothetical protein [Rathayibacter sp. VKM Ac-2630]
MLRLASWQAALTGTLGPLVDPRSGRPRAASVVLDALLARVRPALERSGDLARVCSGVNRILYRGTGAERQRAAAARGDLRDAVSVGLPEGVAPPRPVDPPRVPVARHS